MRVAVLDDWQGLAREAADWDRLAGRADVTFFPGAFADHDEAAARLHDYDILLMMQDRMPCPASLIARLPKLRMIGTTMSNSVLDLDACAARGIVVCKTDGPGPDGAAATAELTIGLLLAAFRSIPQADAAVRRGAFQHGVPVGRSVAGKTLGLIGLGRLGSRVAVAAAALGMTVIAWSPNLTEAAASQVGGTRVDKDELFARADAVSIHVRLSERSRGLVGAAELALMKRGAVLVNTSRGPVIDEAALIVALRARRIVAALDVFDDEPLRPGHPLLELENTVLTPHLGYCVEETWRVVYPQSVENVVAFLNGKPIRVVTTAGR